MMTLLPRISNVVKGVSNQSKGKIRNPTERIVKGCSRPSVFLEIPLYPKGGFKKSEMEFRMEKVVGVWERIAVRSSRCVEKKKKKARIGEFLLSPDCSLAR